MVGILNGMLGKKYTDENKNKFQILVKGKV
ncbi:hypothetical protein CoNPh17_CDS0228 [Staphylococcus phage S-CoN_Ph17]|nr:hypothetical protein CoNPh17_CDS0228 [Staphylococcus phage S-CoN_Ph17]